MIEQTSIPSDQESIDAWAYVELFGHTKIAGRVTTRKLGTEVMFQVDVPKGETEFSHTQLFSPKAIFSINPTTEDYCRRFANAAKQYGRDVLPYIPETRQLAEADPTPSYDPDDDPEIK